MTKHLVTFLAMAALAACGSKSAPAPAAPVAPSHDPTPVATPEPVPKEPEKPAEPAKPDPAKVKADLLAAETSAWETAKPVFVKSCGTCHTKAGKKAAKKKLDHFDFDTYPPGGHHTGTIGFTIRDVLGISGKKATMPDDKPGSVKGDDLAKIASWADAWEAAEKAGAHPPVAPGADDD